LIAKYIDDLSNAYQKGNATEHAYRPYLQALIESFGVEATNEPTRIACGAPDFILAKSALALGYVETKDIGENLHSAKHKNQFNRYKAALSNLAITDYMTFWFFRDGESYGECEIAKIINGKIEPVKQNFDRFKEFFANFIGYVSQTIATSSELAEVMAAKAKLLREVIKAALDFGDKEYDDKSLIEQYNIFENVLIKGLSYDDFSDIYAQTIAYGMFAARIHSSTDNFTRESAAKSIPYSNPFLRRFFVYIAGVEIDRRIVWIIDDLAAIFNYVDMFEILRGFGKSTNMDDPVIRFYETFLNCYDPAARKKRGVYYTPLPVARFIVSAVNDLLKSEFGLQEGLGDTSKIENNGKTEHLVQILDPATGTGAFLAEAVRLIYEQNPHKGAWNNYVNEHLIPRLFGLELLMAPYAIAHLKLDIILKETGFINNGDRRFNIFLTNSLEGEKQYNTPSFYGFIAEESALASRVKQESPIMVVLGNPPYSGESANKNRWINNLLNIYKLEPRVGALQEKNIKWLNDDYVKFIRLAEYFIERKQSGIVAYINNHSFLDNPTFRGMRYHLLQTFDQIYIIDLHGNAKKKEIAPDGSKDENIFDIQQGVSINIFVKTGKKAKSDLAKVYHLDLFGKRETKYQWLAESSIIDNSQFTLLEPSAQNYFFIPKDFSLQNEYEKGFGIQELFRINSVGIVTARDDFTICATKQSVKDTITEFIKLDTETARKKFSLGKDSRDWSVDNAKKDLAINLDFNKIAEINYRPFDMRYTYYTGRSKGFHCMPRGNVMQHFLKGKNAGLIIGRQGQVVGSMLWNLIFLTQKIVDLNLYYRGRGMIFPLYLYPGKFFTGEKRSPNLKKEIVDEIAWRIELRFTEEKEQAEDTFAPIDILDYIYAVLHSPAYREKYKEFLKIDFPKIPYPTKQADFWKLVGFGKTLRELHLLKVLPHISSDFPRSGSNIIEKAVFVADKVYINADQYFHGVSQTAWEFYIGGYQPAQKWLKDRKGGALSYEDITHYIKIVTALDETAKIMSKIDDAVAF
jgi:type I restriction-modification system DNA methylase subunit